MEANFMETSRTKSTMIVIGNEAALNYLLQRYAEQSHCRMMQYASVPGIEEVRQQKPSVIIFSSVEQLQAAHDLMDGLSAGELPVLVCASIGDEARAHELGADECLLHPLTYDAFCKALPSSCCFED